MKFAKRAQYWWHRWTRGVAILALFSICLFSTTLLSAAAYYVLAELLNDPSLEPGWGVILFAVLILLPFSLTAEGLRYPIKDLCSGQETAERERRRDGA